MAIACGADGAHIGQEDLPVAQARRLLGPNKILGVSCKTVEHALKAEADGADYIGSGAGMPFVSLVLARALALSMSFLLLLKSPASLWSRLVKQRLRAKTAKTPLQACSLILCLLALPSCTTTCKCLRCTGKFADPLRMAATCTWEM